MNRQPREAFVLSSSSSGSPTIAGDRGASGFGSGSATTAQRPRPSKAPQLRPSCRMRNGVRAAGASSASTGVEVRAGFAPSRRCARRRADPGAFGFFGLLSARFGASAERLLTTRRPSGSARLRRACQPSTRRSGSGEGDFEGPPAPHDLRDLRVGSPARSSARSSSTRSTPAPTSSWPTSRPRSRDLERRGRGSDQPAGTRSPGNDLLADVAATRTTVSARRRRRWWSARAAGTWTRPTCWLTGAPVSASIFDFALVPVPQRRRIEGKGSRPYSPAEAGGHRKVGRGRRIAGRGRAPRPSQRGTVRVTVLIETIRCLRDGRDPLRAARRSPPA